VDQISVDGIVTTNATPLVVLLKNLPVNCSVTADLNLSAVELATGDMAAWKVSHSGRRAAGSIIPNGTATVLHNQRTAGAAAWTAAFGTSNGGITVVLTGQAGKTITWNLGGFLQVQPALAA
jgi:hypothetical protein